MRDVLKNFDFFAQTLNVVLRWVCVNFHCTVHSSVKLFSKFHFRGNTRSKSVEKVVFVIENFSTEWKSVNHSKIKILSIEVPYINKAD